LGVLHNVLIVNTSNISITCTSKKRVAWFSISMYMLFCSFCYGAPLGGPNGAQLLSKKRLILVQPSVYMYHVSSTRDKLKINK